MEDLKKAFSVVEFNHGEIQYIQAIPTIWLVADKNECWWPNNEKNVTNLIKRQVQFTENWTRVKIKLPGQYMTFKEAKYKEMILCNSSDEEISSTRRRIKTPKKYKDTSDSKSDSSSESEELIGPLPSLSGKPAKTSYETDTVYEVLPDGALVLSNCNDKANMEDEVEVTDDSQLHINDTLIAESSNHVTEFEIMTILKEIRYSLNLIESRLGRIENILDTPGSVPSQKMNLLPTFPFNSLENLIEFEDKLKKCKETESQLTAFLIYTGGKDTKMFLKRCLEKLFSNYVSQFCSWTGKKQNFKLKDLRLFEIMYDATKRVFPTSTDMEFEHIIMAWFQYGKLRHDREQLIK